jgi:hypothetical protein
MTCFTLPIYHEFGGNGKDSKAIKIAPPATSNSVEKPAKYGLFESQEFPSGKCTDDIIFHNCRRSDGSRTKPRQLVVADPGEGPLPFPNPSRPCK